MKQNRLLSAVMAFALAHASVNCGGMTSASHVADELTDRDKLLFTDPHPVFQTMKVPYQDFWSAKPTYYGHEKVIEVGDEIRIHRHLGVVDFSHDWLQHEFVEDIVIKKKPGGSDSGAGGGDTGGSDGSDGGTNPGDQGGGPSNGNERPGDGDPADGNPSTVFVDPGDPSEVPSNQSGALSSTGSVGGAVAGVIGLAVAGIAAAFGQPRSEEYEVGPLESRQQEISSTIEQRSARALRGMAKSQSVLEQELENFRSEHNSRAEALLARGFDLKGAVPPAEAVFQTPSSSPYHDDLVASRNALEVVRANAGAAASAALDRAEQALMQADTYFNQNNPTRGQLRMESFRNRLSASMSSFAIPSAPGASATDPRTIRHESYQSSLRAMDYADGLDLTGQPELADVVHSGADTLLNIGLGLSRFTSLSDVPLSVMEAISGQTVEFEDGKPKIRETTAFERGAAIVTLGFTAAATVAAGPAGAVAASMVTSFGKQLVKAAARWGDDAIRLAEGSAVLSDRILMAAAKLGLKNADEIRDTTRLAHEVAGDSGEVAKVMDSWAQAKHLGAGPQLPSNQVPNFANGRYHNRKLDSDEIFYRYHGVDNRSGRAYIYTMKNQYSSESQLREGVAILEEWGVMITNKSKVRVPAGTWVSEGRAASQTGPLTGEVRKGGDYQALFSMPDIPNSWIVSTGKAFP